MANPKVHLRNTAVKPSTAYNAAVPFRYPFWNFAINPCGDPKGPAEAGGSRQMQQEKSLMAQIVYFSLESGARLYDTRMA